MVQSMCQTTAKRIERGRAPAVTSMIGLLLIGLVFAAGCAKEHETLPPAGKDVRGETVRLARKTIHRTVTATGGLEAAKTVPISTRMMGWVHRIHVVEGQTVREGEPLITIDNSELLAQKRQVEAGIAEAAAVLANAEKTASRFEKLYSEKSVSKQRLDDVLTARDRARAALETAQARLTGVDVNLRYVEIAAPIDGIVARKAIEEGAMASPGQPLLTIEQNGRMKVVARLGEKDVSAVSVGDTVAVDVTSLPGATYRVPLANVIQTANPGSRTYDVEAYLDNPDGRLKSGMFARVQIPVGEREAVIVPPEAIITRGQLRGVFVVDAENRASLRWLRLGHEVPGGVEVLAGLEADETVVVSSAVPLSEGDRVVKQP